MFNTYSYYKLVRLYDKDSNSTEFKHEVELNLAGVKKEDIKVNHIEEDDRVLVSVDYTYKGKEKNYNFSVPAFVKPEDISLKYDNGLLTIKVDSKPPVEEKPKQKSKKLDIK